MVVESCTWTIAVCLVLGQMSYTAVINHLERESMLRLPSGCALKRLAATCRRELLQRSSALSSEHACLSNHPLDSLPLLLPYFFIRY
jgi:hypothetical protein